MRLTLERIVRRVGPATHLYPLELTLQPGAINVLLGSTLAGKTSLMRVMAGLDAPTEGRVLADGADVTGVPVRRRNVSMVYQQFINYPSMTVRDNIASPLALQRRPGIDARVREIAARLHIEHLLDRLPAQLSGGQQQRVALARALAKDAPLMLLDEPLVNLDYKLREGLRDELVALFAAGRSTVVYATTEPTEALLMGGHTAVLDAGELLQFGPTADVFHRPASVRVARAFSDPPMNLLPGAAGARGIELAGGVLLPVPPSTRLAPGPVTVGLRASRLRVGAPDPAADRDAGSAAGSADRAHGSAADAAGSAATAAARAGVAIPAVVSLAEISGSETYVHADTPVGPLVAQLTGVHRFDLGQPLALRADPADLYVFDAHDRLAAAPARAS